MNISIPQHKTISSENGCFSWVNPYHNLETRISSIASQALEGGISDQQKADLQRGFKLAHSWTWPAGRMQKLLSNLPEETIKAFMLNWYSWLQ